MSKDTLLYVALGLSLVSALISFIPFKNEPLMTEKAAAILPAAGSLWETKTGDPFPSNLPAVKVLETKDGWVRYYICTSMPDERCRVGVFLTMYRASPSMETKP